MHTERWTDFKPQKAASPYLQTGMANEEYSVLTCQIKARFHGNGMQRGGGGGGEGG